MVKFSEARLNKALNQRYLDDIEEIVIYARRLLLEANNRPLLKTFEEKLETMKDFVKVDITNRNIYLQAKARADQAKSSFITILAGLNMIERVKNTATINITITRVDALEKKVEKQDEKIEILKQRQQEDREQQTKDREIQIKDKESMERRIDWIGEMIAGNVDQIAATTHVVGDLSHRVTSVEEEIKTIKQDIQSIKSQLSSHVEREIKSNPSQFARMLEREIPKDSPMYNQEEYDQIMAILDGLENKDAIDQFKNTINESLFKFAPKIVESLIDGYLNRKDFALKYKHLKQVDSASATELCKAALGSIAKFNPASETVGMILDGVKFVGYIALAAYNVIIPNLELGRIRESYVAMSQEIEAWFTERLRSRNHTVSYPSFYGDFTPCTLSKTVYEPFTLEDISEEHQKLICDNANDTFKTLNLNQWNEFLKSSVIHKMKDEYKNTPLKEISKRLLVYLAAHKKGQFEEYKFSIRYDLGYDYGANARKALAIRTKANFKEIRHQLHLVSILRLYALYNMSSFGEHCYNEIVNNQILTLAKVFGEREESRQRFLENFDKRCLIKSRGYCSFRVFYRLENFMREGVMPNNTIANPISMSDVVTETVNAATNTFHDFDRHVTTRATIENGHVSTSIEIEGIEGYDLEKSVNSRG